MAAFLNCSDLLEIVIPDTVKCIQERAFRNCSSLKAVKVGCGLIFLEAEGFSGCRSLLEIVLPDTVREIHSGAFEDCVSLKSVALGNGLKTLGGLVFSGCESLTGIVFPDSVVKVYAESGSRSRGEYALFKGCTSLKVLSLGQIAGSLESRPSWAIPTSAQVIVRS
jgi:hypothetical protein